MTRPAHLAAYAGVRTIVLGASGFIGRWVGRVLTKAGSDLHLVVRDGHAARKVFDEFDVAGQIHEQDLSQPSGLADLFRMIRPAVVFNLVGYGVDPAERKIGPDQLPAASPSLLPIDQAWETQRERPVGEQFGAAFPAMVQNTTEILFRDLWLRPDLAPRDRSLVTVSALIANGQVAQLPTHLNKAMDNGLTQGEAAEALAHLAFYVGWPNVFSAMPVAKEVFEKRGR